MFVASKFESIENQFPESALLRFHCHGQWKRRFTYVENGLGFLFLQTFVKLRLNICVWFPLVSIRFRWIRCGAQGLGDPRGFASSRSGFAGFSLFPLDLPFFCEAHGLGDPRGFASSPLGCCMFSIVFNGF